MMISLLFTVMALVQEGSPPVQEVNVPLQFSVTHDGVIGETLSGRVYVMLTKGRFPRMSGPDWFHPEPFFAIDVVDWQAETPLILAEKADAMDGPPSSIEDSTWKAVAVFRSMNDYSDLAAPGGLYGDTVSFEGSGSTTGTIHLKLHRPVSKRRWVRNDNLLLDEKPSALLSDFYGREVRHVASVIVPDEYDPSREEPYPVMYWIGGFGSDHYEGQMLQRMFSLSEYDDQICRVVLNAKTHSGHHTFADSQNNGPRMQALINEWIPYLEETYNLGGSPNRRFLAGLSSGGWTAMWLQVMNPDFFGGAWALAPDPIDFHYFQTVDLYADDANMYVDSDGNERPLARNGDIPMLWTRGFVAMDDVIKDGGQIGSFEWVFSPRGNDGRPVQMFNRETGKVNKEVVEHWKKYDIRRILEENWETISPKLANKINIIAGGLDTFYLEEAVIQLQSFFNEQDFDAMIRVIENGNHGSVFQRNSIREMDEFIAAKCQLSNRKKKSKHD
jgi:hypothetical protein